MRHAVHAGRMSRPDRGHLDNLSVNQFEAVIFGENPGLDHPVIFGRRKRVSRQLKGHAYLAGGALLTAALV